MHPTNRTRKYASFLVLAVLVLAPTTFTPQQANAQRRHAHYVVIQDASFTLANIGQRQNFTFDLPEGSDLSADAPAVLLFMVNPSGGDVRLEVQINDVILTTTTYSTAPLRGVWEVFNPANARLRRTQNSMEFRKVSGAGSIAISDVVLFFKREQS